MVGTDLRVEHIEKLRPEICSLDVGSLNFGNGAPLERNGTESDVGSPQQHVGSAASWNNGTEWNGTRRRLAQQHVGSGASWNGTERNGVERDVGSLSVVEWNGTEEKGTPRWLVQHFGKRCASSLVEGVNPSRVVSNRTTHTSPPSHAPPARARALPRARSRALVSTPPPAPRAAPRVISRARQARTCRPRRCCARHDRVTLASSVRIRSIHNERVAAA